MTMLNALLASALWTAAWALVLCSLRSPERIAIRLGPAATAAVVLVAPLRDAGAVATATFGTLYAALWGLQVAGVDLTAPAVGKAIDGLLDAREVRRALR